MPSHRGKTHQKGKQITSNPQFAKLVSCVTDGFHFSVHRVDRMALELDSSGRRCTERRSSSITGQNFHYYQPVYLGNGPRSAVHRNAWVAHRNALGHSGGKPAHETSTRRVASLPQKRNAGGTASEAWTTIGPFQPQQASSQQADHEHPPRS